MPPTMRGLWPRCALRSPPSSNGGERYRQVLARLLVRTLLGDSVEARRVHLEAVVLLVHLRLR